MWWEFHLALISIIIRWSLQNFVHGMTAVLSWHVHKFVAIKSTATELQPYEISFEFELWWKIVSEMGPRTILRYCGGLHTPHICNWFPRCNIWHSSRNQKIFCQMTSSNLTYPRPLTIMKTQFGKAHPVWVPLLHLVSSPNEYSWHFIFTVANNTQYLILKCSLL